MNGLTGQKMQRIFNALVPETVYADARNLVEYCCFRYLSRDSSHIHPSLKVCGLFTCIIACLLFLFPYNPSVYEIQCCKGKEKSGFFNECILRGV